MLTLIAGLAAAAPPDRRFFVGLGPQEEAGSGAIVDGLNLSARSVLAHGLGFEVNLFGRFPVDPHPDDLDEEVLDIAWQGDVNTTFVQPVRVDAASVSILGDWSPIWGGVRWSGGFDLQVGATLRLRQDYFFSVADDYEGDSANLLVDVSAGGQRWMVAGAAGTGGSLWFQRRFGLRIRTLVRLGVEPELDYGNVDPGTGRQEVLDDELTVSVINVVELLAAF